MIHTEALQRLIAKSPVTFTSSKCVLCEELKCYTLSNGEIDQPCPDCEVKAIDKELNKEIERKYFLTLLDDKYKTFTFDDYKLIKFKDKGMISNQEEMLKKAHSFSDDFEPSKWIVMFGGQGTGKTMIKNCILKELGQRGFSFINTTAKSIYNEWLETNGNFAKKSLKKLVEEYTSTDLLVIDELGRHKITEAMKDFLFDITNEIYNKGKSLMLVTNLTIDKIGNFIDRERLNEQAKERWLAFYWQSYRK